MSGQSSALLKLFRNRHRHLARLVRRITGCRATAGDLVQASIPHPIKGKDGSQERNALTGVLRGLPERTLRAFLMNRRDGLPYAEIARVLGVSASTVEKDIVRTLQASRRWRDRQGRERERE